MIYKKVDERILKEKSYGRGKINVHPNLYQSQFKGFTFSKFNFFEAQIDF